MTDPRAESPPATSVTPARACVLVVDDDAGTRRLLALALEAMTYSVRVASDGIEAMRLVEAEPPDVILLDFEMPGLNGAEACEWLRQHARVELRNIPIVMITAHDGEGEEVACLRAGANDFVTKPISRSSLAARIETQLRLRALNEDLRVRNEELARWRAAQVADLEAARHIQRAILPVRRIVPRWKMAARFLPVIQVGGDMYGVEPMAGGALVWVADATGHGIAAALGTALVALLFHRAASSNPAQVLARVNAGLFSIFEGKAIMSAVCAQFLPDGGIRVAGAGHPPLLVRRADGRVESSASQATLLGLGAEWSSPASELQLGAGDAALLFSDGLFSSRNAQGERQSTHDVEAAFSAQPGLRELIARMRGDHVFDDDLTAISLRRGA